MTLRIMTEDNLDYACSLAKKLQKLTIDEAVKRAGGVSGISEETMDLIKDMMESIVDNTINTIQKLLKENYD